MQHDSSDSRIVAEGNEVFPSLNLSLEIAAEI
jgi:hypothetical protein